MHFIHTKPNQAENNNSIQEKEIKNNDSNSNFCPHVISHNIFKESMQARISPYRVTNELTTYMPYPCSHFYFDIKFGDRLYSKEYNLSPNLKSK